jgi:hypothetical protein
MGQPKPRRISASVLLVDIKCILLVTLMVTCNMVNSLGLQVPTLNAGEDHSQAGDYGIRLTAPLDGWVLTHEFLDIQFYAVVSRLKPEFLSSDLSCKTKVLVDERAIFLLELSVNNSYTGAAKVLFASPVGTFPVPFRY